MPQPSPVTNVQPLRILYASDQIMPSTAADTEQAVNTVAALGRRGVEVHLVLPRRPGTRAVTVELLQEHYQVRGPFSVSQIGTSFDSIRWARNGAHAAKVAGRFGSQHIDLVYTYPPLQGPLRWLMRHPRFLSAFLHSDHTRQSFLRVGIPGERLVVAHNGYDPARMEPRLDRRRARERVELPVEGAVAVYAGRLNERKGLDVVLESPRRLGGRREDRTASWKDRQRPYSSLAAVRRYHTLSLRSGRALDTSLHSPASATCEHRIAFESLSVPGGRSCHPGAAGAGHVRVVGGW